jgi:hypothetical protein
MCQHDTELSKEIQADFVKYAMRAQDDSPGEGGSAANSTNEIVGLQAAVARWKHAEAQGSFPHSLTQSHSPGAATSKSTLTHAR